MTTLVQQKGPSDCVLASIAMAAGKSWEDLWTPEDQANVETSKGIANLDPWLKRAGFTEWREIYVHNDGHTAKQLLWKRRALLSVNSLNIPGGTHMVFWDGEKLWDPHEGHYPKYLAFRHLSSLSIKAIYLL